MPILAHRTAEKPPRAGEPLYAVERCPHGWITGLIEPGPGVPLANTAELLRMWRTCLKCIAEARAAHEQPNLFDTDDDAERCA